MWRVILLATVLFTACLIAATQAAEPTGACAPTPENARDRLAQTGGDPIWALREWRAICPEALAKRYAEALGQASGGQAPAVSPPASSAAASPQNSTAGLVKPPAPTPPEPEAQLVGTFTFSERVDGDDGSGFDEYDDRLTFRADGTAEVKTTRRNVAYSKWLINGCESGMRSGTAQLRQEYRVEVEGSTVQLTRQGPTELLRKEPGCWDLDVENFFAETWSLTWSGGRLTNKNGEEYKRQLY